MEVAVDVAALEFSWYPKVLMIGKTVLIFRWFIPDSLPPFLHTHQHGHQNNNHQVLNAVISFWKMSADRTLTMACGWSRQRWRWARYDPKTKTSDSPWKRNANLTMLARWWYFLWYGLFWFGKFINPHGVEANFVSINKQDNQTLVGGWTNPFEKYAHQIGSSSPEKRGEN